MSAAETFPRIVLAFDTANELISIGVGVYDDLSGTITCIASQEVQAHRASNTQLVPLIDALFEREHIERSDIACVAVGVGPGSFTGVRIAVATAKGIASALGVALHGVSTLDAVAWNAWQHDVRGELLVLADAMRKEVYPVRYTLGDKGVQRLTADRVVKADVVVEEFVGQGIDLMLAGDALYKYAEQFAQLGRPLDQALWTPTGSSLLQALQASCNSGDGDTVALDVERFPPSRVLPVYTRLSDAEEHERARLASSDPKNLRTGVQDAPAPDGGVGRATMHSTSTLGTPYEGDITLAPLSSAYTTQVAQLELQLMGTDAWSEALVADELGRADRTWWVALGAKTLRVDDGIDGDAGFSQDDVAGETPGRGECFTSEVVGYCGGWVVDGQLQILKIAVVPETRRQGLARRLFAQVADDARNLGATRVSLEVRASNTGAQAFYETRGLSTIGTRPRYYSDREDALIMEGSLEGSTDTLACMDVQACESGGDSVRKTARSQIEQPLILAIESSCDETAAALVDGSGVLLADVIASQIDFHARFGGVVPEIASRKHIEAICGVCDECLSVACDATQSRIIWENLDAIAVTYAPGLVGALVVGVAFAKGAAWALDIPFIGVNHLEGHLYANKLATANFRPPAVVSLVSGGNTMLVHMRDWGDYHILGATIDDAVGEAFDKVAKALGLGYPGGPVISRYANQGDASAIDFPRAMLHSGDMQFSLSGLKTAVVNYINKERAAGRTLNIPNIAASFQQAVIDVQIAKARKALELTGAPTFCLGGGVAANPALRRAYEQLCDSLHVQLILPPLRFCGDNAGMIALVALDRFRAGTFFSLDADALASANLEEPY